MSKAISKLSKEKRELIIEALLQMNDSADVEFMLGDLVNLYFMAIEHYLMNDEESRASKTLTFINLHNFLATVDMLLHEREGCYQLAV